MEHTELRTNSVDHLIDFVKLGTAKLDRFRIEIIKDRDDVLVVEFVSRQPEMASSTA